MIRVLRDFCLVKVDKMFNDEVQTKSGLKLYVDTTFRPEHHVTQHGEVVAIPEKITEQYFETKGLTQEVQVGDTIFFKYLAMDKSNQVQVGDELFYKVDYPSIFAYKRNGETHMVGSWVFVEPYVEKKEEKIGLIYVPESLQTEQKKDMGTIINIGKPLNHEFDLGLKKGDKILFRKIGAHENEFEGKEMYVMKQNQIMAKINE